MNRLKIKSGILILFLALTASLFFTSCLKEDNPIKFPKGTFPDTAAIAIAGINTEYDDYNANLFQLIDYVALIFSSNRGTSGGKFDLVQSVIAFTWDQTTGVFSFEAETSSDPFLSELTNKANTAGNDFGPYTFFSAADGYEYLMLASENTTGDLDFYFLSNLPKYGSGMPPVNGPFPATLLNTAGDDAYISFDANQDTAFYSNNSAGSFDIYIKKRPSEMDMSAWLGGSYSPGTPVDSLNSAANDKCPFFFNKFMVFVSDRPGGFGGFDIYYSLYKHGKWSSPVNMGPEINTPYNEYRPLLGTFYDYTNLMLLFSSDRPGGKGGYDLYFRGVNIK